MHGFVSVWAMVLNGVLIIIQSLIRAVSPQGMRIQSAVKCQLPDTETTHNSYAAFGRRTSFTHTQYRNTRHNEISLLWPERGNREFIRV
jgi:hypothetical protein